MRSYKQGPVYKAKLKYKNLQQREMSNQKIARARLHKQQLGLMKQPMENAFVKRQGHLNFYFCIYNLVDDFKDGFYFGLLQLHPNYPFSAPKLFFYTPNGRYEVNMAICTSFTNYHQQSWTSAWNVRSLIQGTISFMYSDEASYGCRHDDSSLRKKYAKQSLGWNMNNQLFQKLFGEEIRSKLLYLTELGIQIYDQILLKQLQSSKQYQEYRADQQQVKINRRAQDKIKKDRIRQKFDQVQDHQLKDLTQDLLNPRIEGNEEDMRNNDEQQRNEYTICKILAACASSIAIISFIVYITKGK